MLSLALVVNLQRHIYVNLMKSEIGKIYKMLSPCLCYTTVFTSLTIANIGPIMGRTFDREENVWWEICFMFNKTGCKKHF